MGNFLLSFTSRSDGSIRLLITTVIAQVLIHNLSACYPEQDIDSTKSKLPA